MSKPNDEREFKVVITVSDDHGNELSRNYRYSTITDYTHEVYDLIETHLEAEDL